MTLLKGTCGCMAMESQGKPLSLPTELPPGSPWTFRCRIDTRGRGGFQWFRIDMQTETLDGRSLPPQSMMVLVHIRVPFLALPAEAYLEFDSDQLDQPQSKTFTLYDDWPGEPLTIRQIESSAPGRLTWTVAPLTGEETIGVTKLKRRYAVTASYRPAAPGVEEFNETLTITPSDPKAAPLVLKLWGRVLRPYSVAPSQLVFHSASPAAVRQVFVTFRKPEFDAVRVVSLPPLLKGEVKAAEARRSRVELTCAFPKEPGRHEGEVVLETAPKTERLVVPVTAYVER